MKNINNSIESLSLKPGSAKEHNQSGKEMEYRSPRVVEIGKAEGLVRNRSDGKVKDWSNSWYTYP